jgi:hypothetical protein
VSDFNLDEAGMDTTEIEREKKRRLLDYLRNHPEE